MRPVWERRCAERDGRERPANEIIIFMAKEQPMNKMNNWNWIGVSVEGEFVKETLTVGLDIQRGGTTTALHFGSIEARLEARLYIPEVVADA